METGSMMDSIHRMTNEIAGALEGSLYCIWLYGSVVFGDFRMGWSDIDFVALTDRPITENRQTNCLPSGRRCRKESLRICIIARLRELLRISMNTAETVTVNWYIGVLPGSGSQTPMRMMFFSTRIIEIRQIRLRNG